MTTVNWEREPGEKVEEFVAALLLLDHDGPGNRVTPSRGDRGVDVRLWTPRGFDIRQIKKFAGPLDAKQLANVEKSWTTFVRQTRPVLPVRSWALVCPWDPTNERLEWLENLTAGHDIEIEWMGRSQLDTLAAQNPALADYYFGDGGERLHRLMADVLHGGRDLPATVPADDLIDAVAARQFHLSDTLNTADPFYRYEIETRHGRVQDLPLEASMAGSEAAYEHYIQVDPHRYQILRIIARHPCAYELRPITAALTLQAQTGSPEHEALENFINHGAPFRDIPGVVTEMTGPPGVRQPTGEGLFTVMAVNDEKAERPDLEVRLLAADGSVLHTLPLIDIRTSQAPTGLGWWIAGRDYAGALDFSFAMRGPDGSDSLTIIPRSLTGRTPQSVLPAVQFAAKMADGTRLLLAIQGGPALTSAWALENAELTASARWHRTLLEALMAIQRHTLRRVAVPEVESASAAELNEVFRVGRLLRGEQIDVAWNELELTVSTPDNLPPPKGEPFTLLNSGPLTVDLNGERLELDMDRRILYRSARLSQPSAVRGVRVGDKLRLVPAGDPSAVIAAVPRET